MLPLVTAGLSLLQQKQNADEQKKNARMAQYMGQAPPQEQGGGKLGMLSSAMGLLGGLGGSEGPPTPPGGSLGSPRYDETAPKFGGGGLSKGTTSYLDDEFGAPGSVSDDELL